MPTILSLCAIPPQTYAPLAGALALAAGPDGLFVVRPDHTGLALEALAQPMSGLTCAIISGERLLVGGTPLGVASVTLADLATQANAGATGGWQAGWMDYTQRPIVALAGARSGENTDSPTLVAACLGDGVLRSANGGLTWELVNTGLADPGVFCIAWAPPPPPERWPRREIVFAGSETGLSRSPAGGRAWHPCAGIGGMVHAVAVALDFRTSGMVLAFSGAEDEADATTLWRSQDGGRSFAAMPPSAANGEVLIAVNRGFVAGGPAGVFFSSDGQIWHPSYGSEAGCGALSLLATPSGLIVGTAEGVVLLPPPPQTLVA